MLGSSAAVEQLRRRVAGVRQSDTPQLRALQSHGTMEEHLARYRQELGIDAQQYASLVRPTRHRERPMRDILAYLLWQQGRFRLGEIGMAFGVKGSAISQACRRAEHRLQTDPRLRKRVKSVLQ